MKKGNFFTLRGSALEPLGFSLYQYKANIPFAKDFMATALELTRRAWQSHLKGARRRSPLPAASVQGEREQVLSLVRKAANVLKTRFGVRRLIPLGSLARTESFYPQSDVDLAVEGLTGDDYCEAWRMVEETITDRPVDLIDVESAGQSVLEAIQRYGTEL